jgi:hypothetical protein
MASPKHLILVTGSPTIPDLPPPQDHSPDPLPLQHHPPDPLPPQDHSPDPLHPQHHPPNPLPPYPPQQPQLHSTLSPTNPESEHSPTVTCTSTTPAIMSDLSAEPSNTAHLPTGPVPPPKDSSQAKNTLRYTLGYLVKFNPLKPIVAQP